MSVASSKSKQRPSGQKPKREIIGSTAGHLASKQKKSKIKTKKSTTHSAKNTRPAKKQKTYTDKELGIPKLNMIVPAGVQKPKGKKKGKVYVDDIESMMTIYAMVNAEKEGQIESKMMKARQLEEIREARAKEVEARQQTKRDRIDELKDVARGKKNGKFSLKENPSQTKQRDQTPSTKKKKVGFADP